VPTFERLLLPSRFRLASFFRQGLPVHALATGGVQCNEEAPRSASDLVARSVLVGARGRNRDTSAVQDSAPLRHQLQHGSDICPAERRSFVARILIWRVNYSASPFLSFSNLIQYDNESRNLGWQSRMRWILRPGNDLFLVFSQGWIQDAPGGFRFRADESKVSTKFQYTFRF